MTNLLMFLIINQINCNIYQIITKLLLLIIFTLLHVLLDNLYIFFIIR